MAGEVRHTPTPWEVFGHGRLLVIAPEAGWSVFEIENPHPTELPIHEANVAHIVRCVNAHDELVEALKNCVEQLEGLGFDGFPSGADEILAKLSA